MLAEIAGVVWKKIPWSLRRLIVRVTQAKFTVSAAVIVTNGAGEVLLLDHRIRPSSGWGIPGGFLEHGEQPESGVRREVGEEIGLELSGLRMLRVRTLGSHIEILFRAFSDGVPEVKSPEIKGFGWFPASAMPEGMHAGQRALVERVLSDQFEK